MYELHNMLVQEEIRFKNLGGHSIHYVSHQGNQRAKKKFMKKHNKGIRPLKFNGGICANPEENVRLGLKRNVNLMLMYVLDQI